MSHPKIYFRESELKQIQNEYYKTKESIDSYVKSYFTNTTSIDNLYFKVGALENKEDVYKSFKSTAYAIESFGKTSVKLNFETAVDPFSYLPFQSFEPTSSKGAFYIGIVILFLFVISSIKKWKIKKFFGFILIIAFGINLYNYFIKEPEFLARDSFNIDADKYRNEKMLQVAQTKFIDLYERQPSSYKTSEKSYEYEVLGTDEYGNDVEGYVETSGKYGEGYITTENGDEVEIEIEWTGNGVMVGIDRYGNEFDLKIKD